MAVGEIGNETVGYIFGIKNNLVEKGAMDMQHVRFRQHMEHEMAHYVADCWDLEITARRVEQNVLDLRTALHTILQIKESSPVMN